MYRKISAKNDLDSYSGNEDPDSAKDDLELYGIDQLNLKETVSYIIKNLGKWWLGSLEHTQ